MKKETIEWSKMIVEIHSRKDMLWIALLLLQSYWAIMIFNYLGYNALVFEVLLSIGIILSMMILCYEIIKFKKHKGRCRDGTNRRRAKKRSAN